MFPSPSSTETPYGEAEAQGCRGPLDPISKVTKASDELTSGPWRGRPWHLASCSYHGGMASSACSVQLPLPQEWHMQWPATLPSRGVRRSSRTRPLFVLLQFRSFIFGPRGKPSAKSHFRDFRVVDRPAAAKHMLCPHAALRAARRSCRHPPITFAPLAKHVAFHGLLPENSTRYVPGEGVSRPMGPWAPCPNPGNCAVRDPQSESPVPGATPKSVFDAEPMRPEKKAQGSS